MCSGEAGGGVGYRYVSHVFDVFGGVGFGRGGVGYMYVSHVLDVFGGSGGGCGLQVCVPCV